MTYQPLYNEVTEALYINLFKALPGNSLLLRNDAPRFTIIATTPQYIKEPSTRNENLIGKGVFDAFPSNPSDPHDTGARELYASLEYVLKHKLPHHLPMQRYDSVREDGSFTEKYWHTSNRPVFNDEGILTYIIHTAEEITDTILVGGIKKRMQVMEQASNIFMQAPVAVFILKCIDYVVELANEEMLRLFGTTDAILGKSLIDILPDAEMQGLISLLGEVRSTGQSKVVTNFQATIVIDGIKEKHFFNLVLKPYFTSPVDEEPTSIFCVAHNVTQQLLYQKQKVEDEFRFRSLIEEAIVAMGLYMGRELRIQYANKILIGYWGKDTSIIGKSLSEAVPELKGQPFLDLLDNVYTTGIPYTGTEEEAHLFVNGTLQTFYFNITYKALRDKEGTIYGIHHMSIDVTDQVLIRKKIERSEQDLKRFKFMADNAQDPLILMREDGTFAYLNKKALEAWGYGEEEVKHLRVQDVYPTHIDTAFSELFTKAQQKSFLQLETLLKRKDGQVYTVEVNFNGIHLEGVPHLFAVARDITERKKNENAIKDSEQKVRALVESAPFPIGVYVGMDMRIELANQSLLDVWGKGSDVIGKLYFDILPELENQKIFSQLNEVYNTGIPFHARNKRVDLIVNGKLKIYFFNYSFTPLFNAAGQVYGVMNTAADVTDLNVAKQKVEHSEKNFRQMIMQSPVAMCILMGPDHIVDIANEAMVKLWGKSRQAVMHKPMFMGLPDAREQGLEQILANVYKSGESFEAKERPVVLLREGKKETVYQNFVYEPYKDAEGKILGVLAISTEVTEQVLARQRIEVEVVQRTRELREANESLLRTNQELKRSNANLEEFAHAASHDLKEPIRKVQVFSDLLKRSFPSLDNEQQRLFERVEDATERMGLLIEDLLDYSHVSMGVDLIEEIDLNEKVEIVLKDLEIAISDKGAQLTIVGLPKLKGHKRQLQQLFHNLIQNALKYSRQDKIPQINISAEQIIGKASCFNVLEEERNKPFHLITVKDNGIGFEQEHATQIFQMFKRLHGKGEYKGSGVGLAIVKKVVENHKGYIRAEGKPGEGAVFYILLPAI